MSCLFLFGINTYFCQHTFSAENENGLMSANIYEDTLGNGLDICMLSETSRQLAKL
jgi:hypothetical protein